MYAHSFVASSDETSYIDLQANLIPHSWVDCEVHGHCAVSIISVHGLEHMSTLNMHTTLTMHMLLLAMYVMHMLATGVGSTPHQMSSQYFALTRQLVGGSFSLLRKCQSQLVTPVPHNTYATRIYKPSTPEHRLLAMLAQYHTARFRVRPIATLIQPQTPNMKSPAYLQRMKTPKRCASAACPNLHQQNQPFGRTSTDQFLLARSERGRSARP